MTHMAQSQEHPSKIESLVPLLSEYVTESAERNEKKKDRSKQAKGKQRRSEYHGAIES